MIKYINNRESNGIQYDLSKIRKIYRKLNIPNEFDFIDFGILERNKIMVDLSERSIGKTTAWLLLGMCFNYFYDTKTIYVRESDEMIKPSKCQKLFDTIKTFNNGEYINKLTNGKYNSVVYHWKSMYYANIFEENGKIITEKSPEPFLYFMSIDKNEEYKSTFNSPTGDIFLFDEFISSKIYKSDSFFRCMDLFKTVARDRLSPYIIFLANTINKNSQYFEELCIRKEIRYLEKGNKKEITTELGTKICVRLLEPQEKVKKIKAEFNKQFLGFKNPLLSSITGSGSWSTKDYQHITTELWECDDVGRKFYIRIAPDEHLQVRLVYNHITMNVVMLVNRATIVRKKCKIFTLQDYLPNNDYIYGFGNLTTFNRIKEFVRYNKIYYSTNEVGDDFINFYREVAKRTTGSSLNM